jgi:hypothetical protein
MRVTEPTEDIAQPPAVPSRPSRSPLARALAGLAAAAIVGGLVAGFFLSIYVVAAEPIGWDTARYLDQTNLASAYGITGASHLVIPRPSKLLASRVGFPTTVLSLAAFFHTSIIEAAALVPAAAAVATALAAGAFVSYGLRRGIWVMAVVALIVGTSAALVRLTAGTYTDNLIADALFTAALVPLLSSARDGRGFIAATLLLAIGGLAHPAFFVFMLGVLALVVVAYVPESWRAWRRGDAGFAATASARLGLVVGGATGITAAAIYGFLGAVPDTPTLQRPLFVQRFKQDLPLYRLYVTGPLAAVGAWFLARGTRGVRPADDPARGNSVDDSPSGRFGARFILIISLAWIAVTALGLLGFAAGKHWPAHRFLAFLLPLPILAGLGVIGIWTFLSARTARPVAAAVTVACLAGLLSLGAYNYASIVKLGVQNLDIGKIHDALGASAYLRATHVPLGMPVVIVMSDSGPNPALFIPEQAHILRSAFQPERIPHLYFYVGTPEDFLLGQPTIDPNDGIRKFNKVSRTYLNALRPILSEDHVALLLSSYNPAYGEFVAQHPDLLVAPNVVALRGPGVAHLVTVPPVPAAPHRFALPFLGSAVLVLLALLGGGWSLSLLPEGLRPFEVLAVSLAFGFAVLMLAGIAADALGVRLVGLGGILPATMLAAAGWALGTRRLLRRGWDMLAL